MSKIVNLVLGVIGAVIGFYIGGPAGAMVGFGLGYGLGTIVDPMTPDMPSPGEPMNDLELMTNEEGIPLPDVLGTTKMTGNLLYYGNNYRTEVTEEVDTGGGSGGSSSEDQVTGYKYFLSWAMGFCLGPMDNLYTVWSDDTIVWAGDIPFSEAINGEVTIALGTGDRGEHQELGDALGETAIQQLMDKGAEIEDGFMGLMTFYFGTADQIKNTLLGELMLEEGVIESLDYHIPYQRQCWAYLHDNFIGDYNRCPTIKIVVRKAPECSFDT
jgi:hypothetical protein